MGCLSVSAPIANEIRVPAESWEDNTEIEVTSRGGWLQNRVSRGEARCLKLISGPAGTSRVFCFPFLELSLNPEGPAWGREITSGKERNKEGRQRKWSFTHTEGGLGPRGQAAQGCARLHVAATPCRAPVWVHSPVLGGAGKALALEAQTGFGGALLRLH